MTVSEVLRLARAWQTEGRYHEALALLDECARQAGPGSLPAQSGQQAECLIRLSQRSQAIELFVHALAEETSPGVRRRLLESAVRAFRRQGEIAFALEFQHRLISELGQGTPPSVLTAHLYTLAEMQLHLKDHLGALQTSQILLSRPDGHTGRHYRLKGDALTHAGRIPEAKEAYLAALRLDPSIPGVPEAIKARRGQRGGFMAWLFRR